jgi:hypothetical protein
VKDLLKSVQCEPSPTRELSCFMDGGPTSQRFPLGLDRHHELGLPQTKLDTNIAEGDAPRLDAGQDAGR